MNVSAVELHREGAVFSGTAMVTLQISVLEIICLRKFRHVSPNQYLASEAASNMTRSCCLSYEFI